MKPYTKLALTEAEFKTLQGSIVTSLNVTNAKLSITMAPNESRFYLGVIKRLEALQSRFAAILLADHSQDADEDEDDAEEGDG